MISYDKKIGYIDNRLGFYFEGGIASVGAVGEPALTGWCSLAFLFHECTKGKVFDIEERQDIFDLLQDYYTSAEVEVMAGDKISDVDMDSVGYGYDIDIKKYSEYLDYAKKLLEKHGVDLLQQVELDIEQNSL